MFIRRLMGPAGVFVTLCGCVGTADSKGTISGATDKNIIEVASPLCTGGACNGQDPYGAGCVNGAVPVRTAVIPDGKLELFWSPTCKTNWAQVTRNVRYLNEAWIESSNGVGQDETKDRQVSKVMWSSMWYAPSTPMRACAFVTTCEGDCDSGEQYCTDYR